jgi:MFS family permease
VLRNRSILGLLTAELVSMTGTAMTMVALPWFVLVTTGSTAKMGWVLAADLLPMAIVGIPAGTLIARLGAKRTMLMSDLARGCLMLVIPILYWTGHLTFPLILLIAFLVGCFTAPYFGSNNLVVLEVVGDDEKEVARVNAILGTTGPITQIFGPVLAGFLIASTSPATVLVIDAGTYLFSFLTIGLVVRAGKRIAASEESKGLLAGLRYIVRDKLIRPIAITACGLNFFSQGLILGVNALAYFHYHSAHVLGFLFGAFGVGAVLGAVAAQPLTQKVPLLRLAAIGMVLMPLPIYALGIVMPWQLTMIVIASFGFFNPLVNAPLISFLMVRTPESLRPKVMTAGMTLSMMAGPLGFLAAGEVLRWISVQQLFVIVAIAMTVGGLIVATILLRSDETAAEPSALPV